MDVFLFIAAIFLLLIGHYFKMLRWKQFVEIYESPNEQILLRSLTIGYLINFCLPFRIGELIRIILSGRKMKNGISFAFSTVLVDRCLDIIVVSILFSLFAISRINEDLFLNSAIFYGTMAISLIILSIISVKYSRLIKIFLRKICSIFNPKLQLNMLFFCWSIITSFKDIFRKVNKFDLIKYSSIIWISYLSSYFMLGLFLAKEMHKNEFFGIFSTLFSRSSLDSGTSNLFTTVQTMSLSPQIWFASYLLIPLLVLWVISYLPTNLKNAVFSGKVASSGATLNLLPQVSEEDRLNFLEAYFSGNGREYLAKYIELNQNVSILQDYSAGSNATVMLCIDENKSFYRKYAFGEDGDKLYEQLEWLRKYENRLPLPKILSEQHGDGYCSYDMEYSVSASGFFNYMHSRPIEKTKSILRHSLDTLAESLYNCNSIKADNQTILKYIDGKVKSNLEKIKNAKEIKHLYEFDELIINGRCYKNLKLLEQYLEVDYLIEVFKDDIYTEIHGDLTIENIICTEEENDQCDFYLIDPNTGNIHNSPNLDYAKLLQSLHGGYEFLMKTQTVSVNKNEIKFLFTRSQIYDQIFAFYLSYLQEKFDEQKIRSIFFHEVIHWLRLMPYKIEKNGKRSLLFYAGFIMVLNDVIEWYSQVDTNQSNRLQKLEQSQNVFA
ncbi:lysylphosphatidylglycerol synthase transmembrane domain-containing protein [Paenibacillus hunanensis]|uniref:Phosphatidylglycerol lysyltransferase n=1 Tax=Paenibacillus hunanensis TaxID=539262 RepID=A0ABU1ITG4_9BACL|nr:lysylphosphatidylglycerol synthase transmembrane domain-containing protein [Paenibacillus hunanensis]MDR6242549.1 hypothetical protein [Paenibacillus hunanensis]GGJ00890.1 hypothetical protein GCM10008022_07260 [Paenibacillus hunanensis]